jgi:hypothetical protein
MHTPDRALLVIAALLLFAGCSDTLRLAGPGANEPPDDSDDDGTTVQFDSEAPPGDSARSFLTDQRFAVLSLEVNYMEGCEPTAEALTGSRRCWTST